MGKDLGKAFPLPVARYWTVWGARKRPSPSDLLEAIESGDLELVERLLKMGADIRGAPFLEDPAACAVRKGHLSILELLIRHGADPRYGDDYLFCDAVGWDHRAILKLLAATVFSPDLWRGKTLLDIQKEAELIYQHILQISMIEEPDPSLQFARFELVDAAMTCWERVRPDPPKLKISDVPPKPRPL